MEYVRRVGYIGALILSLVGWKGNDLRKEYVRLVMNTQSGAPARVRLVTRGLIALTPRLSQSRQPWQVITTVSTSAVVELGGIGEADIRLADTTNTLIIDVIQVRPRAGRPQRVIGQAFRVSRTSYSDPFVVTPLTREIAARQ